MPPPSQNIPLASTLVARFLRTNNYTQTLKAFLQEAGLPSDAGEQSGKDDATNWTIENLIEEKKAYDQSKNFERYGDNDKDKDVWTVPAPTKPNIIQTPSSSNLLACSVGQWQRPDAQAEPYLIATGADKHLHLFQTSPGHDLVQSFTGTSEAPILSYIPVQDGKYILMTNMSGQLLLQKGAEIIDRRKDHAKYAVKVIAYEQKNNNDTADTFSTTTTIWIATAGWDSKIFLYRMQINDEAPTQIGDPIASIPLLSNPESILFTTHIDNPQDLILLVSRRDSSNLYYYHVKPSAVSTTGYECPLIGKQNLAPHSNAWVAFSPSCLALSPHDPGLIAIATSTLPHMKVMIVRLLFPSAESLESGSAEQEQEPATQAAQAFAALSLQNREDAAILIQANTFAPQTAYSTPQVVWRPDGSGVWVNGDDGVVRGLEVKTGKVVTLLKDGHEVGCKIRTLWAGWVDGENGGEREEWLPSVHAPSRHGRAKGKGVW
ncbi:hypothetical protein M752DRAFT_323970 [Aspergillus phoenicis ATCC 13157]|uniref:Uncharacterized protein n=1 Tax=Aspergillus phoenicis ATCC 13157 TaxID=1353007 RepID=A0A370PWF2_ASPPH|nr:hypothetical protein M752DRAFT_323970 [Aspergillus phoenicis ATCC 13157]